MSDDVRGPIRAAVATARQSVLNLRHSLEAAEQWEKLLSAVDEKASDRPAEVCALLTKQSDLVRAYESADAEAVVALRAAYVECTERAQALARDSVRVFPEAVQEFGVPIDSSSRHPRYTFAGHAIEVELDQRALTATIAVRHGDKAKVPLDIAAVAERVRDEHRRLFDREWKPAAFLSQVKKAYKPLAKKGDAVLLRDIAASMSKPKKPRLDEFAVDMGRLLQDPILEDSRPRLSVQHTRDTRKGLLLHGLERGGYVLTITLEESA